MFTLFILFLILQSFYRLTHATVGNSNELPSNYQLFFEARNWVDAELFCQQRGGHLISIHDETTNLQIANYLLTALPSHTSYAWIGFNQGDEIWTDHSAHDYTPSLHQNPQGDCTAIDSNPNPVYRGYWMGPPCDNAYPFMCNIPSTQQPKETTIPTTTTFQPNICMWGRDGSNAQLMNGEWTYEGIFNEVPYYSLSIDASFGLSIQYLWLSGTQYYITDYPPGTLSSFRSTCTVSSNDPISCGQGNWRVGAEASNDPNVFVQHAPCPQWDCDEIITTQTYAGCDGPFNQKIGQNEYYNGDNLYWYFSRNYFSWICSDTISQESGVTYYAISQGWTDVAKGKSIYMNFQFPTTDSFQVQCIKHNSIIIPTTTTPQPTNTVVTRLCTEELHDFNVGAIFAGNGGCQQHASGSLLSQDTSGSASFLDCLKLCEEYGCKSFLFGKKGLSKENWCNAYSVECIDNGDKEWYMFTPINNAEIMCNSIN